MKSSFVVKPLFPVKKVRRYPVREQRSPLYRVFLERCGKTREETPPRSNPVFEVDQMNTLPPNAVIPLRMLLVLMAFLFTFSGCLKSEVREKREHRWATAESGLRVRECPGMEFTLLGYPKSEVREKGEYRWATAESGLRMREGPGLDFASTGTIPFGGEVEIADSGSELRSVDAKWDRWYRVIYRGQEGYAFGGFLSDTPVAIREQPSKPLPAEQSPGEKVRPAPVPKAAASSREEPERKSPLELAYAVHNTPSLVKLSLKEFEAEKAGIAEPFRYSKEDFRNSSGAKDEGESVEEYLRSSKASKSAFLEKVREAEYSAATRTYSIYDAELAMGEYSPALHRFDYLGTTVDMEPPVEVTTLPAADLHSRGFQNGMVQDVKLPNRMAKLFREQPESILVRLDFSYALSLQDIFGWTSRAYFLPRYLMLYNRNTGEIYYECAASPRIERGSDLAAPLKISSRFLYQKIH
jgi:hypothetical protein